MPLVQPRLLDEKQTTVYKRAVDKNYHLKMKASRFIFSEINTKFPIMPFTARCTSCYFCIQLLTYFSRFNFLLFTACQCIHCSEFLLQDENRVVVLLLGPVILCVVLPSSQFSSLSVSVHDFILTWPLVFPVPVSGISYWKCRIFILLKAQMFFCILLDLSSHCSEFWICRALEEKRARLGLVECVNHELLQPYPVLHEKPGQYPGLLAKETLTVIC